jgi:hypothetical protein
MKTIVITMTNAELSGGSNAEIGLKLQDIIQQSLLWWHSQFGESDSLKLDRWEIESIAVQDMPATPH